eukprot:3323694-Amphidinium_carterae.4
MPVENDCVHLSALWQGSQPYGDMQWILEVAYINTIDSATLLQGLPCLDDGTGPPTTAGRQIQGVLQHSYRQGLWMFRTLLFLELSDAGKAVIAPCVCEAAEAFQIVGAAEVFMSRLNEQMTVPVEHPYQFLKFVLGSNRLLLELLTSKSTAPNTMSMPTTSEAPWRMIDAAVLAFLTYMATYLWLQNLNVDSAYVLLFTANLVKLECKTVDKRRVAVDHGVILPKWALQCKRSFGRKGFKMRDVGYVRRHQVSLPENIAEQETLSDTWWHQAR